MEEKSLNMDAKITIKNLCPWDLYFYRKESPGEIKLDKDGGVTRVTRAEVQAQVFSRNKSFAGIDGRGSHARIWIEDEDTRRFLGFEDDEHKQFVMTEEKYKELFAINSINKFKKEVERCIVQDFEKAMLVNMAIKEKLDSYSKVQFIQEYTGIKF